MNTAPLIAEILGKFGIAAFASAGMVILLIFAGMIWASRYTKCGPNQVIVISGRQKRYIAPDGTEQVLGFRIVKGGGTFVIPVVEKVDILSLELLTIDVQTPEVYTSKGVP